MKRCFTVAYIWHGTGEGGIAFVRASSAPAAEAAMQSRTDTEGNLFIAAVFEGVTMDAETAAHLHGDQGKKEYVVAIVHRELTHYSVRADSEHAAIEKAKACWVEQVNEVRLGSEFADIERAYVDDEQDREEPTKGDA
jgi:hypothetical protein